MTSKPLHPLSVVKYNIDHVAEAIRHITGWSQKSEVRDKVHLTYLDRYLLALDVATIVIENEYIDRHYLEDYVEYYARCFHDHPRACARIHFFKNSFDEAQFTRAVVGLNQPLIDEIKDKDSGNYLGFVVLRPIPQTCIARMCLRPYSFDESSVKLIRQNVKLSLFGIGLTLETLSFLEQDKVVSACATSAIWVLLNAHGRPSAETIPSPSAITKSAFSPIGDDGRIFPANNGLKLSQVARSLKSYGLDPTIYTREEVGIERFNNFILEAMVAYLSSGYPLLVAGKVKSYEKADGGKAPEVQKDVSEQGLTTPTSQTGTAPNVVPEERGRHLVCAVGYRLGQQDFSKSKPERIDQIYVHDDRYGPYVALQITQTSFECYWIGAAGTSVLIEEFEPEAIVVGLNPKIRIGYPYVRSLCEAIQKVGTSAKSLCEELELTIEIENTLADCQFEIALVTTEVAKEAIRRHEGFFSYNGSLDKSPFVLRNLPRYMWQCRFHRKAMPHLDLLIDATEVPQGNLILATFAYDDSADSFLRQLKVISGQPTWVSEMIARADQKSKPFVSALFKFLGAKNDDSLSSYYGPLRLPNRSTRDTEVDKFGNTIELSTIRILSHGEDPGKILNGLDISKIYLWVIDEDGNFVYGEEPNAQADSGGTRKPPGHHTLVNSRPARIGGELHYADGKWAINSRSGTYSHHLTDDRVSRDKFLGNVIRRNLLSNDKVILSPN